ncbi:MAG TPA: NAD(P)H-hydrate dehydratase [Syntrophobacter fumaroxidans]|nr:NAD(P)H-hydrate dehydratase [Syntrophobacter fumaroxidans]
MSWLIVGTVPRDDFPLYEGRCLLEEGGLRLDAQLVPVGRGTPALLAAACIASQALDVEPPLALLAGDTGRGKGSIRVYEHLCRALPVISPDVIVFHYLQPDVDRHNRVFLHLEELARRPVLVADAGFMYVAKMSGFAACYDLFTPDVGELAFLADEKAPHPFYTRGFILQEEDRAPELIQRAYRHENASGYLLVKGRCDIVASSQGILEKICEPVVEAMEPIGGTGDTLTALAGAFIAARYPIPQACSLAAKVNRVMGLLARPTPASTIADLLRSLPEALKTVLR